MKRQYIYRIMTFAFRFGIFTNEAIFFGAVFITGDAETHFKKILFRLIFAVVVHDHTPVFGVWKFRRIVSAHNIMR